MPKLPSKLALEKIAQPAYVPAIGYAYVESKEKSKHKFSRASLTFGKMNVQSNNVVDDNTRFPASSLSKIVFTYLVLQLVKRKKITLDEPLHNILQYERFKVNGEHPEKAKQLTARHILSHTTGLPNFGPNLSSPLAFNPQSELGKGYSYSGEAFLYLQKVIEKKMGKDLETLAQKYVFRPLKMKRSTFNPQQKNNTNAVAVHTELGKPTSVYVGNPVVNAAGSLLTTADDFSKFMSAWLENMNDPIFKQAFESTSANDFPTCGLGWHIYKNENKVFAYQYGENPNTRSFMAINITDKKGAVFFSNSENGMSIANQVFNSSDLPPIGNMQAVYDHMHYDQSDEPGWRDTLVGKIAEDQNGFEKAKDYFVKASQSAPNDKSKQRRLEWFNAVHQPATEKTEFKEPLESFEGKLKNRYNDEIDLYVRDRDLIFKQFDQEIKLVRISETEFLPEKDQSFKINFNGNQVSILYVNGKEKSLDRQPLEKFQKVTSSYTPITSLLDHHPVLTTAAQIEHNNLPATPLFEKKEQLDAKNPIESKRESQHESSMKHEKVQYPQLKKG